MTGRLSGMGGGHSDMTSEVIPLTYHYHNSIQLTITTSLLLKTAYIATSYVHALLAGVLAHMVAVVVVVACLVSSGPEKSDRRYHPPNGRLRPSHPLLLLAAGGDDVTNETNMTWPTGSLQSFTESLGEFIET